MNFNKNIKTVVIVILGYNLFKEGPYHEVCGLMREWNKEKISDDIEYHYIQLPKFIETVEEIKTDEEAWIGYISNQLNKEEMEEIFKMKRSIEEIDEIVKAVLEDKDVNDELNRRIYRQYDKLAALQYAEEKGEKKKLVSDCLEDIGRIHQECVKLKIYREDEKTISLDDVSLMVVKKLGDSRDLTFEFVRVLASKDKKKALEMYHELEKYSIEAIPLIGLLASQFLIMYQVKILEKRTNLNQEIADVLGEKPYRIQKTRELTRYYSEQELRTILRKLADMDLKIKSSDVDGNFLIELFILEQT